MSRHTVAELAKRVEELETDRTHMLSELRALRAIVDSADFDAFDALAHRVRRLEGTPYEKRSDAPPRPAAPSGTSIETNGTRKFHRREEAISFAKQHPGWAMKRDGELYAVIPPRRLQS